MGQSVTVGYLRSLVTVGILMTVVGCAGTGPRQSVHPNDALKDAMATSVTKQSIDAPKQKTRAMDIFFYQSRVGDAVMDKYPFLDAEDGPAELVAAEARMMAACSHLAQAALHKVSGGEPGVRLKFMVFLTLDACEDAARNVETLLSSETMMADSGSL